MSTDAELLRRYVADRAEDAFAELVRRHLQLVYFAALRQLGDDPATAQDVAQSVFIDLARKARSLSHREILASWLYTSTRFATTKARRARARRLKHEMEAEAMRTLDDNPESPARWESLRSLIDEIMHELREPDRAAVLLRFFEQRPFSEIAATLRVSEDAARMRVERAMDRLRASLARRGVASTSAALGMTLGGHAAPSAPVGLAATVTTSALAASTGAAATGAVVLHFVGHSKMVAATAAMLAGLAVGAAAWQIRQRRAAEAAMAGSRAHYVAAMADVRRAEAQVAVVEQALASSQLAAEEKMPTGLRGHPPSEASAPPESRTAVQQAEALMARHPEVRHAIADWHRKKVNFQYGPLYRELSLTPAQIERFGELVRAEDFFGDWGANGTFLEFRVPRDTPSDQINRVLQDLLGPEGGARYRELSKLGWARQMVAQMASHAWMLEVPLTPEQAQGLVAGIARVPFPSGGIGNIQYWERLLEAAGELALSRDQLAILEGIAGSEMRGARMANAAQANAPKAAVTR